MQHQAQPGVLGVSLNRTSVGLKPSKNLSQVGAVARLNRTSVGLKRQQNEILFRGLAASIEPAWD